MLTKIKVYACYTVNIYKNKPQNSFKPWGAWVLDTPLNLKNLIHPDLVQER